jgi:enolase-phosphatase E1
MESLPKTTRIARCALLDIEGTVADVRFVYDVMFPFVREHLREFLQDHWNSPSIQSGLSLLAIDAGFKPDNIPWKAQQGPSNLQASEQAIDQVVLAVGRLMDRDSKTTGLKSLQGLVWESGFRSGKLRAEVFADVVPALERWKKAGVELRIYSSGSILAQKLFFAHTTVGDLTPFFKGNYDTTIGSKKEPESYLKIAEDLRLSPTQVIFFTDVLGEIQAARSAQMQVIACVRPNNAPLPKDFDGPTIESFDQVELLASPTRDH